MPGWRSTRCCEAQQSALGAAIEDAAVGGLGVHLITALTDRQSYHRLDGCNILRLIKLLESHPDQRPSSPASHRESAGYGINHHGHCR